MTKLTNFAANCNCSTTEQAKKAVKKQVKKEGLKSPKNGLSLDTLEQLNGFDEKAPVLKGSDKSRFKKRAKAKFLTNSYLFKLIDLDSPLKKSYWHTHYCSKTLYQNGQKLTASYCGHRWCLVCNRIRAAKLINGYKEPFSKLVNPHFVTLTIPNCEGENLKSVIDGMTKNISKIQRNIKDRLKQNDSSLRVIGVRKLEITWNCYTNEFHPHFHLIVESKEVSRMFVNDWLKKYPTATKEAQDFRECNNGSMIELFKYFTKIVSSTKEDSKRYTTVEALDTIFQSMRNKRVFQPFGGLKKVNVSDDISGIRSEDLTEDYFTIREYWEWNGQDWTTTEHKLCGFEPTEYDKGFTKLVESYKDRQDKMQKRRTESLFNADLANLRKKRLKH